MKKNFNSYKKIDKNICSLKNMSYQNYQENLIHNHKYNTNFKNNNQTLFRLENL